MDKIVDGITYEQVHEKVHNDCTGCAGQDAMEQGKFDLCNNLRTEHYCQSDNMIYKIKKESEMNKLNELVKDTAIKLLENNLIYDMKQHYGVNELESDIDDALMDISNDSLKELIEDNLDLSIAVKTNYIEEKVRQDSQDFIDCFRQDKLTSFDGIEQAKGLALQILENQLMDELINEYGNAIIDYELERAYRVIQESEINSGIINAINLSIDNFNFDDEIPKSIIGYKVDNLINKLS